MDHPRTHITYRQTGPKTNLPQSRANKLRDDILLGARSYENKPQTLPTNFNVQNVKSDKLRRTAFQVDESAIRPKQTKVPTERPPFEELIIQQTASESQSELQTNDSIDKLAAKGEKPMMARVNLVCSQAPSKSKKPEATANIEFNRQSGKYDFIFPSQTQPVS
jgi:hypothetical protein